MRSLLVTAEAVARSALMRKESRGAHTRIDYEGERDEWVKCNIVCRKGSDGHMDSREGHAPAPVKYLEEIANSKIEDLESGKIGADAPND
jgi:succinate dehydrogenase / fumarate reductase flavoprotein subunit